MQAVEGRWGHGRLNVVTFTWKESDKDEGNYTFTINITWSVQEETEKSGSAVRPNTSRTWTGSGLVNNSYQMVTVMQAPSKYKSAQVEQGRPWFGNKEMKWRLQWDETGWKQMNPSDCWSFLWDHEGQIQAKQQTLELLLLWISQADIIILISQFLLVLSLGCHSCGPSFDTELNVNELNF